MIHVSNIENPQKWLDDQLHAFLLNSGDTGPLYPDESPLGQVWSGLASLRPIGSHRNVLKYVEIPTFSSTLQLFNFLFLMINRWLNIQFLVSKSPFLMLRIPWSFQSQVSLCVSILCGTQLIPDGFWPTLLVPWRGEKRSPTSCGKNELPTAWRHGRWEFGVFGVRTFLIQRSACVPTRK